MKKLIYIIVIFSITVISINAQYKKGYSLLSMPERFEDWYRYDYQSLVLGEYYSGLLRQDNTIQKKSTGVLCLLDFLGKEGDYKSKIKPDLKNMLKQTKETVPLRQLEMKVTPNPVSSDINVMLYLPESSSIKLEVFNMLGKKALELSDNQFLNAGSHQLSFNRGTIPTGAYYLKLYANHEQAVQMIVFE